ncbi:MAG: ice-binding family protein, partial [Desulfotomaculaceae bacterium]
MNKFMKTLKLKHKMRFVSLLLTLLLVVMMAVPIMPTISMAAEATVDLGTTESFAVLAGSTITNTGSTTIKGDAGGDVGLSPGTAVTGFPPGTVSDGTIHAADAAAGLAQDDLVIAYNDAADRTTTADLTDQDLGGLTLTPGVYSFSSSAQLTGTLTLDGQNALDPVFVFQVGSTLTTASGSNVNLINGARYCRTFWQVGSSATLGTNSDFVGHIFAMDSITATTGAKVQGQLLARNGAVTLDSNTITNGFCAAPPAPPTTATLNVIKHVINDDSGTAVAANFNLHVKTSGSDVAASPAPGVESPGTSYTLAAGTYVVSEDAYAGYNKSYSGDSDSSGNITLASGDNKTVTVTNNDIPLPPIIPAPATLHVIKHVINDDGRTAVAADFILHVKTSGIDVAASPAPGVESPGTTYTLVAGTYVVSEDAFAGYTVGYSGNCDPSGNITLAPGDNKTVTVTNFDIAFPPIVSHSSGGGQIYPPLINVIKTPEPLALTSGQGLVTYTYKVTNPGMVALSNVSVTDDKVSPVNYVSGDVNADNLLQPSETWIYTGTTNLDATTTNTATAKGSANGITATDIAFATVVVTGGSTPTYPPLINVIKTPAPLALTSGQGPVTYTYKVTNPGVVALSNVSVTDDKVSPVTYVSGDVNADNLLEPNETWI